MERQYRDMTVDELTECDEIVVGDWVRFYRNGLLVIGQVEYIRQNKYTGDTEYQTDAGSTTCILEWRHKS